MAYTRTGRPPGRPKTKEYVTLTARVPQDIAEQAQRHALRHGQTISEILRKGLLQLLQEQDSSLASVAEMMSDMNRLPENVSDMNRGQAIVSDTNGALEIVSDSNSGTENVSDTNSNGQDYDVAKYVLGKLCRRQHDYEGTGQSLLRLKDKHCIACDREKAQARREAKRL